MKAFSQIRRSVSLLLALVLVFSLTLTGCASHKTESSSEDPASSSSASSDETAASSGAAGPSSETAEVSSDPASEMGQLKSFEAETIDGGSFTSQDLAGKDLTIFNFWSVTCGPCVSEMPDLAAFQKALPDNVALVTVLLDGVSEKETAQSILDEAGYEGITLVAGSGDLLDVVNNIMYMPTSLLADSEGNLRGQVIIGKQPDFFQTYQDAVNEVLSKEGKDTISVNEE